MASVPLGISILQSSLLGLTIYCFVSQKTLISSHDANPVVTCCCSGPGSREFERWEEARDTAERSSLWDSSLNPHQEAKHPCLSNRSLLKDDGTQLIPCNLCICPHGSQVSMSISLPELMAVWSSGLTPLSPVMKTKAT